MGTTLVVNPGSSSKKYGLYHEGSMVVETRFEDTDSGYETCSRAAGTQQVCEPTTKEDFESALEKVAMEAKSYASGHRIPEIDTVAMRIVAPGTFFQKHAEIDNEYIEKLRECEAVAPLHIPTILREILAVKKQFPNARLVAASDSAFHADMPAFARAFSIPKADAEQFDIYRFGYHGLSVASIVRRIHPLIGQDPERMIVCHVGNGVSVTAVKKGKSVDTTMGYSPTSGVIMGSRAGDVEAAALLKLIRAKNLRPAEADMYINTNGGLKGLAGDSDIRHLLIRRSQNDEVATHALDTFAYQLQKAIAELTVPLGGVDVLVLTATAMVRSSDLRALVLKGLKHIGVEMSPDRNDMLVGKDGVISVRNSPVKIVVMRTDEMGEMAYVANQLPRKK